MVRLIVALTFITACVPYSMGMQNQQMLARLCSDPQAAYEHGYNKGMAREPMTTAWVDTYCAPEARDTQRQAYINGYQTGAQYAPAGYGVGIYATNAALPPPHCELNSDGSHTCGYNCHLGSDGYHYCASTPAGQCAFESNGTWACP